MLSGPIGCSSLIALPHLSIGGCMTLNIIWKVALGAIYMVLLDVLIEPFAVYYGLWVWEGRVLPSLANYVAWFFGGCGL